MSMFHYELFYVKLNISALLMLNICQEAIGSSAALVDTCEGRFLSDQGVQCQVIHDKAGVSYDRNGNIKGNSITERGI